MIASRYSAGNVHLKSHKTMNMTKNNNFNISEKTEERFGMYLSIFRIAGVGISPHKHSKFYVIYALCAFVCTYATAVAMFLDVLQHTDDLQYFMNGIQTMCAGITVLWIYQFLRYCRSNITKSLECGMDRQFICANRGLSLISVPYCFEEVTNHLQYGVHIERFIADMGVKI
jgi:hypothetical protein